MDRAFSRLITDLAKAESPKDKFGFVMKLASEALADRGIRVPEPASGQRRKTKGKSRQGLRPAQKGARARPRAKGK